MARVTVTLKISERDALVILAEQERRDPRAQTALLIRGELERRGLLPVNADAKTQQNAAQQGAVNYANA
jgi:hypothetical protein